MECRFAQSTDYLSIVRTIQNKRIDFIPTKQVIQDLTNNNLILCIENNKIVGMCSLTYDEQHNYTALKRLLIPNKKNYHKGIGKSLLTFICQLGIDTLGATPWDTNIAMIRLLEKYGFQYQYTFNECWTFYLK